MKSNRPKNKKPKNSHNCTSSRSIYIYVFVYIGLYSRLHLNGNLLNEYIEKSKITKILNSEENSKWKVPNQMIKYIKRMDNNCHIPHLVQACSNVENGGLNQCNISSKHLALSYIFQLNYIGESDIGYYNILANGIGIFMENV